MTTPADDTQFRSTTSSVDAKTLSVNLMSSFEPKHANSELQAVMTMLIWTQYPMYFENK